MALAGHLRTALAGHLRTAPAARPRTARRWCKNKTFSGLHRPHTRAILAV
jgi:hypothetical protein